MNSYGYDNEFDKNAIYGKLAEISSKLEEEQKKADIDRDAEREIELMYAKMIEGMKLNTLFSNRKYNF